MPFHIFLPRSGVSGVIVMASPKKGLVQYLIEQTRINLSVMVCTCSIAVWKYILYLDSCDNTDSSCNSDSSDSSDSIREQLFTSVMALFRIWWSRGLCCVRPYLGRS